MPQNTMLTIISNLIICSLLFSEGGTGKDALSKKPDSTIKKLVDDLKLSAQFRTRYEYRDVSNYNTQANIEENTDLLLFRTRLGFELPIEEKLDLFVQLQDARTAGTGVPSNTGNIDALQAYIDLKEIKEIPLSLRLGRQKLNYGNQRMISDLDWNNISRSWDGAKLTHKCGNYQIDAFYTVILESSPGAEDDQKFYGLYGSSDKLISEQHIALGLDLYLLQNWLGTDTFASETTTSLDERIETFYGGLLKSKLYDINLNFEYALERGVVADNDINASGWAFDGNYTFKDLKYTPKIGIEYSWASGDSSPSDGDLETFTPPFPFSHNYQGYMDIFAWKNGSDLGFKLGASPSTNLWALLDYHIFRLAEPEDAWYNAAGTVIKRDSTGNSGRDIGSEIDLHFKYQISDQINLWAGWSHFFHGDFVEKALPTTERNMDWIFIQVTFNI